MRLSEHEKRLAALEAQAAATRPAELGPDFWWRLSCVYGDGTDHDEMAGAPMSRAAALALIDAIYEEEGSPDELC